MKIRNPLFAIVILASVSFVGCSQPGPDGLPVPVVSTGKATGGGWIASASGEAREKANFGFNVAKCDTATPVTGHFNYHDKDAPDFGSKGVKMNGEITGIVLCSDPPDNCGGCPANSFQVEIEYRSTNPKNRGDGTAFACVLDNGEGKNAPPDTARIQVDDGPFGGYSNQGTVQGNIQFHTCTCTDGIDNNMDGLTDEDDPSCLDPDTGAFDPNRDEE